MAYTGKQLYRIPRQMASVGIRHLWEHSIVHLLAENQLRGKYVLPVPEMKFGNIISIVGTPKYSDSSQNQMRIGKSKNWKSYLS